jgi:hypothetical protein
LNAHHHSIKGDADGMDEITKMELQQLERQKKLKYNGYKKRRRIKEIAGEQLSTSEDEDGNKKTGYELTPYMEEYNKNTKLDYAKGYEPK